MTDDRQNSTPPGEGANRRGFGAQLAAVVLGGLAAIGPLCIGLFSFLDPLGRRRRVPVAHRDAGGGQEGFYRVASLDALAVGAAPQRFPVIADKVDAWNFKPDQPIGAVYIERIGDQSVRAFNVTCPHAGCSVDCNGTAYHCPCHNSSFNLDGSKRDSVAGRENPSRRGLDSLMVDEQRLADGEVWVEFMDFKTGIEEKKPKQ